MTHDGLEGNLTDDSKHETLIHDESELEIMDCDGIL